MQGHIRSILPQKGGVAPVDNNTTALFNYGSHASDDLKGFKPMGERQALSLNGTGAHVTIQGELFPTNTQSFSWGVWFKWRGGGGGTDGRNFVFETSPNYTTNLFMNASGKLYSDVFQVSGNKQVTSVESVVPNRWYYAAGVYQRGGTYKLYLDAKEIASVAVANSDLNTMSSIAVGSYRGFNNRWFNGGIHSFQIWNKTLSVEEVKKAMEKTLGEAGVVGYWKMNEGEGQIAFDSSAAGNDAVITIPEWKESSATYGFTRKTMGVAGNGVLVEEATTNHVSNPTKDIESWRSATGVDAGQSFNGYPVFYATSNGSGTGWRHVCGNGGLELAPGEKASTSIWMNKGTTDSMPAFYMQGYIWDEATSAWIHKDPVHGHISTTAFSLKAEDGSELSSPPNSGWYKEERVITNTGTVVVRLTSSWYYLTGEATVGTCYHAMPQLEKKTYSTSFVDGSRPLSSLRYSAELFNKNEGTVSFWLKKLQDGGVDHHFYVGNSDGFTGVALNEIEFHISTQSGIFKAYYVSDVNGSQSTAAVESSGILAETGKWHHLAVAYKVGQPLRFYVNGKAFASPQPMPALSGTPANTEKVFIGRSEPETIRYANQIMENLRIDHIARTAEEIQAWYHHGRGMLGV